MPRRGTRRTGVKVAVGLATAALLATVAQVPDLASAAPTNRPWMLTSRSPDERALLLLQQMTLEEKVELMTGDQGEAPSAFYNGPITRLGIPELRMADGGAGIAPRGWTLPDTGDTATAMPASIALAATWNPRLATAYAGAVTREAKATGHAVLLGPNADIIRQPFWGRSGETPSEDPELTAAITTPYVAEVQRQNVIANLKHYVGYTQEVNRGDGQNDEVSERALHEVYTLPWKEAIEKADLASVMCSFNKINDVFACENDVVLDTILRDQLGFEGFVLTDFGAIHSTGPSVRAGTDMETGTETFYDGALLAAVRAGTVPEALVNRSVKRILRTMFALGVFDRSYPFTSIPVQRHGRVARDVQDQAITLLKNSRSTLPVSKGVNSVAVIGGDVNIASTIGGSARVAPTYQVSLLEAMRERAESYGATLRYERGNDPVNGANMIETADMTAVPSSVLTPQEGSGNGLTAQYWGNTTFTGDPAVTRREAQVAYDTGFVGGSPAFAGLYASQVPATPSVSNPVGAGQSAVYRGFLTAPGSGSYRLNLTGWGDAKLFLNDRLVVDMTGQSGRRDVTSGALSLRAGQRYAVRVEYSSNRPLVGLQPGTLLMQWSTPNRALAPSVQRAARAAARSDVAVVYLRTYETEERDRVSLKLPQNAEQLVRAVRAANPRTVVVLSTGGAVTMPWLPDVRSVVQNYFGGQEEGDALARVIFGDVNPSGHLPVTFPRSEADLPNGVENPWDGIGNPNVAFSEDVNVGYRGYLADGVRPLFPFGHGLSYTSFAYSNLRTSGLQASGADARATVRVAVRNTGRRAGTEVVQVYLGQLPGVQGPPRKLAGFAKVRVAAGRTAQVTVQLDRLDFSTWDSARDRWVTPRGSVRVYVGTSATRIEEVGTIRVR